MSTGKTHGKHFDLELASVVELGAVATIVLMRLPFCPRFCSNQFAQYGGDNCFNASSILSTILFKSVRTVSLPLISVSMRPSTSSSSLHHLSGAPSH